VFQFVNQLPASFSYLKKRVTRRAETLRLWLREGGLKGVVGNLAGRLQEFRRRRETGIAFDRSLGVDTAGPVGLWHLRIPFENLRDAARYEGVDPAVLRRLLSGINGDLSSFTFIDLGCGKGRALLVASEFKFDRIIGVEFAAKLAQIATRNCHRLGVRAEILWQDAAEFSFPPGKMVVYLYNPFGPSVLNAVLDHLLEANTRESYVVYVNPLHRQSLDKRSGFKPLITNRGSAVWKFARQQKRPADSIPSSAASLPMLD
jgi:predicted RNA methylase